jgi:hypothetical protein
LWRKECPEREIINKKRPWTVSMSVAIGGMPGFKM